MSNQDVQLEIMAEGGFDVTPNSDLLSEQEVLDVTFGLDYFTPERIIILREKIEQGMDNPCTSCQFNESIDPHVLDHCHYHCKDSDIAPIEFSDEVGCPDCTNVDCTCEDATLSPLELQANYDKWNRLFGDAL